ARLRRPGPPARRICRHRPDAAGRGDDDPVGGGAGPERCGGGMIKLYHCADARSFRALWALEELGLPYELVLMPFPPRARVPGYRDLNPLGTVPVMFDGEHRMTESAAMGHYLGAK